ncbi:bifunctional Pseudouridine synthase I [Babesia duncani]|uniref:Bifunctional Pseudouridine synthase I n=1 Tax=Babesia duncani TaxID=323732 RepID=A0AAD9PNM1_9APIC|nr:bifunctional Pseudouridine synthase I [Babesia duncani]
MNGSDARKSKRKERLQRQWAEKKQRLERRQRKNQQSECDEIVENGIKIHVPKKKFCIAFGYVGTKYHGYQKQQSEQGKEPVTTIEGTIHDALISIGAINKSIINRLQLSKASRTDKGVHAACTYIGGKFEFDEPLTNAVEALNDTLPNDIRCFQILRVTKGFDARSMCSKRKYEYIIPEYILKKRYKMPNHDYKLKFENLSDFFINGANKDEVSCSKLEYDSEELKVEMVDGSSDLDLLQNIFSEYCGTHDFRNFTPKQKGQDATTQRFIHKIKVKTKELDDGSVIVRIVIVGQSFLYNQIRKMIALAIEVYLQTAPKESIKFALSSRHSINVGIAPSEGLFLHHGGDFVQGDGTGSISIYGHSFPDENFKVKHVASGILGMVNTGPDTNGCQFYIITKASEWLNGKNVAFGRLIDDESQLVLHKLENVSVSDSYKPKLTVSVSDCGQL